MVLNLMYFILYIYIYTQYLTYISIYIYTQYLTYIYIYTPEIGSYEMLINVFLVWGDFVDIFRVLGTVDWNLE